MYPPTENTPKKLSLSLLQEKYSNIFFQDSAIYTEQRKMENEEENEVNNFLRWAAKLGITDSPLNLNNPFDHFSCLGHSLCVSHFPNAGG